MKVDYRRLRLVGASAGCDDPGGCGGAGSGRVCVFEWSGRGRGCCFRPARKLPRKKFKTTIAQEHDFSCGSAALATLLSYNYGISVTEQSVFAEMFANGDQQVISESRILCST